MNYYAISRAMSKTWLPPKLLLTMKLTTILLFLALVQVSAKGYSQISIKEKNVPLERILEAIKKQSGYVFFYDTRDISGIRMSIDVKTVSIETVLNECTKVLPLTFKLVGNNVLLRKKELSLSISGDYYKLTTLKGKVLDEKGMPLPGVSIILSGDDFKQSTQTTGNGEYIFNVPKAGKYVLTASFIGYEKYSVAVDLKKRRCS